MKYLISLIILSILIFTGCSENQQINSPNTEFEIQKTTNPEDPSYLDTESAILLDMIPEWISLPAPSFPTQTSNFSISKWIYNSQSNNLIIDTFYVGGLHGTVDIKLKLMFIIGSLPEDSMFVSMEVDIQNGTIKFGPKAVFIVPARIDYKLIGLDFTNTDPYSYRFIYAGDNGIIEPVKCFTYEIDEALGSVHLVKGEIPHFSRYGFVRRTVDF